MKKKIPVVLFIFSFLLFICLNVQSPTEGAKIEITLCGQTAYANPDHPCPEAGCDFSGSNYCSTPCNGIQYWYWLGR